MADLFLYRADPVGQLIVATDQAALCAQLKESGLAAITPGSPISASEYRADPVEAIARIRKELSDLKAISDLPVKLHLPLTAGLFVDPMLVSGPLADLIEAGAGILQFDGRLCASDEVDASTDGFMLAGLPRPEGFRTAVELGALSDWPHPRLLEVVEELEADRYVISLAQGDDLSVLSSFPNSCQIVLALLKNDGSSVHDDVLSVLDAVAEIIDQERVSLTAEGGFEAGQDDLQAKVLNQISEISTMFWGLAV